LRIKEIEDPWDVIEYNLELFNPLHLPAFTDGTEEGMYESIENTAYLAVIFGSTAWILAAISGAGASMPYWFGMGYPGLREIFSIKYAAKKDLARLVFQAARHPATWIFASTAAHAYTSSEIERMQPGGGAQMSLAGQYSVTGQMSGGSMPTVGSLDDFTWTNLRKEIGF